MNAIDKSNTADREPTIAEVFFSIPAEKRDEFYDIATRLTVHEKGAARKVDEFLSSLTDRRQWLACVYMIGKIREEIRKAARKKMEEEG